MEAAPRSEALKEPRRSHGSGLDRYPNYQSDRGTCRYLCRRRPASGWVLSRVDYRNRTHRPSFSSQAVATRVSSPGSLSAQTSLPPRRLGLRPGPERPARTRHGRSNVCRFDPSDHRQTDGRAADRVPQPDVAEAVCPRCRVAGAESCPSRRACAHSKVTAGAPRSRCPLPLQLPELLARYQQSTGSFAACPCGGLRQRSRSPLVLRLSQRRPSHPPNGESIKHCRYCRMRSVMSGLGLPRPG